MLSTSLRFLSVDHLSASMFCFDKRCTILAGMSIKKTKKLAPAGFHFRPVYIIVLCCQKHRFFRKEFRVITAAKDIEIVPNNFIFF